MKTLGIVGGIGPESTIDYYRSIILAWRDETQDGSAPSVIINSIDLKKMLDLVAAGSLDEVTTYLSGEMERLAQAGASVGLLAANTPHIVFDDVQRRSSIPLIGIVEATCAAAEKLGMRKLGLFGVRFTMQGRFFSDSFSKVGIGIVVPDEGEQSYIHNIYMNELVKGIFLPETRERLLAIADRMVKQEQIDGLILAGTELPLILRDAASTVPFLDTTQIHVKAALRYMLP
jgi:aspartate racemase